MRIFIYRKKDTKKYAGYVTATFPVSTDSNVYEYVLKDISDDEYGKVVSGWEVEFDKNDNLVVKKPDSLINEENKKIEIDNLRAKLVNDTATLEDIKSLLKLKITWGNQF